MDCRREANRRGLTILGPKKIFNSSLAHIAFLYVSKSEDPRRYHDAIFERFWRREFNLESYKEITGLMKELGYDAREFSAYFNGLGLKEYQLMQTEAENSGVFGVPSWRYNGELYWGLERLGLLKKNLKEQTN
jgi:2-hydroxychromene-2-carboxylate isomerase